MQDMLLLTTFHLGNPRASEGPRQPAVACLEKHDLTVPAVVSLYVTSRQLLVRYGFTDWKAWDSPPPGESGPSCSFFPPEGGRGAGRSGPGARWVPPGSVRCKSHILSEKCMCPEAM